MTAKPSLIEKTRALWTEQRAAKVQRAADLSDRIAESRDGKLLAGVQHEIEQLDQLLASLPEPKVETSLRPVEPDEDSDEAIEAGERKADGGPPPPRTTDANIGDPPSFLRRGAVAS